MISKRLVELREAQGMNQAELARRAALHAPTVSRAETGDRLPSLLTLCALVLALDVPADALLAPVLAQLRAERAAKRSE